MNHERIESLRKTDPLAGYVAVDDYVAARPSFFRSKSSWDTLMRHRGKKMREQEIVLRSGRGSEVHPERCDAHILDFMKRGEGFRPPNKKKATP